MYRVELKGLYVDMGEPEGLAFLMYRVELKVISGITIRITVNCS